MQSLGKFDDNQQQVVCIYDISAQWLPQHASAINFLVTFSLQVLSCMAHLMQIKYLQ